MGNLGFEEILLLILVAAVIVTAIFYLITLQNTLKAISPKNRKMEPGSVWVMLVPVLNAVFIFFIVEAIGVSLKREYEKNGVFKTEKPTAGLGIAMAILWIAGVFIPFVSFAGLVCWVIHWIKVNEHKNAILALQHDRMQGMEEPSIFIS
ncbi:MAG TPA: hypothetical protein VG738_16515 [Chitinophagaceae bacterium]|nr:hypothetical protein [Chitinophagaceae bacterium]